MNYELPPLPERREGTGEWCEWEKRLIEKYALDAITKAISEVVDINQIAIEYGRREGNLWYFDDLALSIFISKIIGLYMPKTERPL